eukprot:GEMP01037921.1.p1 GENE.GEMP01037921.1~~GEMP01037921.1.p1  ORF type:complete len:157 (-),score=15.12 GEMP01037921.1:39-509(-)
MTLLLAQRAQLIEHVPVPTVLVVGASRRKRGKRQVKDMSAPRKKSYNPNPRICPTPAICELHREGYIDAAQALSCGPSRVQREICSSCGFCEEETKSDGIQVWYGALEHIGSDFNHHCNQDGLHVRQHWEEEVQVRIVQTKEQYLHHRLLVGESQN